MVGARRETSDLDVSVDREDQGDRLDEEDGEDREECEDREGWEDRKDEVSWTLSSERILVAHRRFATATTWWMKSDSKANKAVNHCKHRERILEDNMAPVSVYVLSCNR